MQQGQCMAPGVLVGPVCPREGAEEMLQFGFHLGTGIWFLSFYSSISQSREKWKRHGPTVCSRGHRRFSAEQKRVTIEQERNQINSYKEEIRELKQRLESKQEKLDLSRDKILREANEQARNILQEAKDYADTTIRNFQKYGKAAGVSAKDMEKERGKLREKMSTVDKKLSAKNAAPKKSHKQLTAKDLHIGDSIKVLSLNLKGTVSTLPDAKGNLFVQMGILRSQVNIRDLEKLDDTVITGGNFSKTGSGKIKMSKSASVSTEINLLGKTVDEAIMELDKYLDDAYIAHLPSVRIVHGKGTGALRKGVHNYLRRQKHVKSYRLGEFGEGDAGVTIVEFK